jgi:hypothetical protein
MEEDSLFDVKRAVTTIDVRDADGKILRFNANRVGPSHYFGLHNSKHGPRGFEFRRPTFGELVPLIYSVYTAGKNTDEGEEIIESMSELPRRRGTVDSAGIAGKTIIAVTEDGIFVDDGPEHRKLGGGILRNDQCYVKSFKDGFFSTEKEGIFYSDDGKVRFTEHGFESAHNLAKNRGVVAIVGDKRRAEMLARLPFNLNLGEMLGTLGPENPGLIFPTFRGYNPLYPSISIRSFIPYDSSCETNYSYGILDREQSTR